MNPYIQLEASFYRHPKTLRLKRAIGEAAYWIPPRLWCYCAERRNDSVANLNSEDLKDVLEFPGEAKTLMSALVDAGFLTTDGKTVSGWFDRYGKMFEYYHERAKKAASTRWGSASNVSEKNTEKSRVDKIRKHRQASSKHASSMLVASDMAETIYKAYPKKVKKAAALKCIQKVIEGGHSGETLLTQTQAYAAAVALWPPEKRQYVPDPTTWFNQGRYEDDPSAWQQATKPTPKHYVAPLTEV